MSADRQRQKRQVRAPKKYEEDEEASAAKKGPSTGSKLSSPKAVIRLLLKKDVNKDLRNKQVYILWPDDNKWYEGQIQQLRVKEMVAHMWYPETDEKEDVDLADLIQEGQIGFKESRPRNYKLTAHEVPWEQEEVEAALPASKGGQGKQQGKGSSSSRGRGGSEPKGPKTAQARKMKRISGDSSGEAEDGSEDDQEEEMDEEEEKVPVPRSRRSRGRGVPVSQPGDDEDGAASDQDVSLSSSDGGGDEHADGDEDVQGDERRASKALAKKGSARARSSPTEKANGSDGMKSEGEQPAEMDVEGQAPASPGASSRKRSRQGSDQLDQGSPKKSHTSTASAGAPPQLPSAAAPPSQGPSPGRSRRQVTLTPKAQELLAQASSGLTSAPPQWPFTVDALAPPHQQLQQQLHQQHLQQQLMMQRQQYHLQQQQLQQQQLQQQQLLHQQHQQQIMAPIVPRRPRSDLANQASSPRRPRVSDFSYPSAAPGPGLPSSVQPGGGLGGYGMGLTPEMLAAMRLKASEAPFYAPAHNLTQLGSLASRPRPLEQLPSAHSGDDSNGLGRSTAVPGRPAGSMPLAPPGPNKNEEEVQQKARAWFQEALKTATEEAKAEDAAFEGPPPAELASAIEAALLKHYGGVTKDYKLKLRTISANLKDPKNPALRRRVLVGDINPDALVRMESADMASEDLQAWRAKRAEQALKNAVLDEEAAAKFSTAAAVEARIKREAAEKAHSNLLFAATLGPGPEVAKAEPKQEVPAVPARTSSGIGPSDSATPSGAPAAPAAGPTPLDAPSSPQPPTDDATSAATAAAAMTQKALQAAVRSEQEQVAGPSSPRTAGQSATEPAPAAAAASAAAPAEVAETRAPSNSTGFTMNWASIKEQAVKSAPDVKQDRTSLGTFDAFLGSSARGLGVESAWGDPFEAVAGGSDQAPSDQQPDHYLRDEPVEDAESAQPPEEPAQIAQAHPPNSWDPPTQISLMDPLLISPPADLLEQGWQGSMTVPDLGSFELEAVMLAGAADITSLLPSTELEPKGRLSLGHLESFFEELRKSRSRTLSLGLLRASAGLSPSRAALFDQVPTFYAERDRASVLEQGSAGEEFYLLPACPLANRLLATAKSAAATVPDAAPIPSEVPADSMLIAIVHRKDLVVARRSASVPSDSERAQPSKEPEERAQASDTQQVAAKQEPPAVEAASLATPQAGESAAAPDLQGLDSLYQSIMGTSMGLAQGLPELGSLPGSLPLSVLGLPSSSQAQPIPMSFPMGSQPLPASLGSGLSSMLGSSIPAGSSSQPMDPRARRADSRMQPSPSPHQDPGPIPAGPTPPPTSSAAAPVNPRDPRARRSQQGPPGVPPPPPPQASAPAQQPSSGVSAAFPAAAAMQQQDPGVGGSAAGQFGSRQPQWQGMQPEAPIPSVPAGYAQQSAAGLSQQPFMPYANQQQHHGGLIPPPPPHQAADPSIYPGLSGPNPALIHHFQTVQSPYPLQAHVQAPSQPQPPPPPMQFVPQNDAPGMQGHGHRNHGSFRSPRGGGWRARGNSRGAGRRGHMAPLRGPY
ncbi:hypothetical protein WJX74_006949 [Apatococcus lobatus]|uniref:TFIIS central domain-containing protein n=1 Tax=Apatococcus lobatus TaxID=904363 RepID=A0AAW1RBD2_9CHLO